MVRAFDTPAMPHAFYGSITVNGELAQIGTEIRAFDQDGNDITYEPYFTTEEGWYGGHSGLEKRFIAGEPIVGDIIYFFIELLPGLGVFGQADQTYEFKSGDVTQLNLSAVGETPQLEGYAVITGINAPTEAGAGENISVSSNVRNDGGEDAIFAYLSDTDTDEIIGNRQSAILPAGNEASFPWNLIMPNKQLNITIKAGHEE